MRAVLNLLLACAVAAALVFGPVYASKALAETTSVAMVPKTQLDALQKRYDALEDKLRREPQCIRMWTNLPKAT